MFAIFPTLFYAKRSKTMDRLSASVESSNENKINTTKNSSLCDSCDNMRDLLQKKDKEIELLKRQLEIMKKNNHLF